MSTSSSEENAEMASHSATSSGLESTGSLLFSVPSDYSSDVHTEITPSTSPAPSEGKMRTPRDILDASRRLGQIYASTLQVDVTPTKSPKHLCHRASSRSVGDDEAGYDADGDGDGDGDGDEDKGARAGTGATATTRPIRRPAFPRIDTRQHRRVASMLATRRPSPGFEDVDAHMDISYAPRARFAPLSSIRLKSTTTTASGGGGEGGNGESYELRRRVRQRAEPVGLGIGFPENHPLRSRAFTMPIPRTSVSPVDDPGPSTGLEGTQTRMQTEKEMEMEKEKEKKRRSEWLPLPAQWLKKTAQIGMSAPSSVLVRKLALRPTILEVSPSPIDYLPGAVAGAGTFHCDADVDDPAEVSEREHRHCHSMGVSVCDARTEQERYTLVRRGEMDLSELSTVTLPARSEVTATVHVESHSALSQSTA